MGYIIGKIWELYVDINISDQLNHSLVCSNLRWVIFFDWNSTQTTCKSIHVDKHSEVYPSASWIPSSQFLPEFSVVLDRLVGKKNPVEFDRFIEITHHSESFCSPSSVWLETKEMLQAYWTLLCYITRDRDEAAFSHSKIGLSDNAAVALEQSDLNVVLTLLWARGWTGDLLRSLLSWAITWETSFFWRCGKNWERIVSPLLWLS